MISKALRGHDVAGLLRYLFGPGRANEHTNQRIVASSDPTWAGTHRPDRETLRQLADEMHDSVRRHGDGTNDGYVYHVAISLAADDRPLDDTQWQHVAERFADKLGLRDHVSWLAVNHGPSANGNDHIHLVINLIHDDTGRAQPLAFDRLRRREACIDLEDELGLSRTSPAGQGRTSTLSRREVEALRNGRVASAPDLNQHRIATIVRAVATGSRSEQEFVERLRGEGLIVRPRHARGDRDTVTGYSVALRHESRTAADEPLIWYGGGRLGKDLRLPALRASWSQTAGQRDAAAPAWLSLREQRYKAEPPNLAAAVDALRQAHLRLQALPPNDQLGWHTAMTETAGLLAAAAHTATSDQARRELINAWQAIARATPVSTHIGIAVAPGDAAHMHAWETTSTTTGQHVGSDQRTPARSVILWPAPMPAVPASDAGSPATELLKGASRVIMAARRADNPQQRAVSALLQQAAELAVQIARAVAAQRETTAAQQGAVTAAEAALRALTSASRPAGWQFARSGTATLEAARIDRARTDETSSDPASRPQSTPAHRTEPLGHGI